MTTMKIKNNTIEITKTFAQKAARVGSPEYYELLKARKENPSCTVEVKQTKSKDSFKGLTYEYMEDYILTHGSAEEVRKNLAKYEELLLISECHSRARRYPAIKSWFLEMYPEVVSYGSVEERPKILQIGEKRAS